MALLSVEKVKKSYKDTEVLKEISFTINRGEIVALASTPLIRIHPDLIGDKSEITFNKVVFPIPFGPAKATISPRLIVKLISLRTSVSL